MSDTLAGCHRAAADITTAPRLLLSAYQCGPGMGSVSQIGWQWYSRLARRLPVTLFTHVRNRPAIEAAGGSIGSSTICYIDTEWFAGPLYKLASRLFRGSEHGTFMVSSLDYFVFDRSVVRTASQAMQNGEDWDVVHAVTPVSPLAATGLHRLGRPVILGPWNGHLGKPAGFDEILKRDAAWLYPLRAAGRVVDAVVGCSRNAAAILTATRATREGIAKRYQPRCRPMLENGVDLKTFAAIPWTDHPGVAGTPLRLVFVGRLLPVKGVDMLIEAVAGLKQTGREIALSIVGAGPAGEEWQALVARLGLAREVSFMGNLGPDAVAREITHSHALCLPSIRESGGGVLLEAMACARPVIAFNFGGPAEIVSDEVGHLISARNRSELVRALQATLQDLFDHPEQWQARGIAGRHRVETCFGWDAKMNAAIAIYRELTAASDKPSRHGGETANPERRPTGVQCS
jgi:glycosyltransferase involved in cell wall biosynthesis